MSISDYRAAALLDGAVEGGSNYWYLIESMVEPETAVNPWGDDYCPRYVSFPFSIGGAVVIKDIEDDSDNTFVLDRTAIARGKRILMTSPDYSLNYADVLKENDDADTSDVFLQLCLFGEVIYG